MILTKKDLRKWEESSFTLLTETQRNAILERFGTEPEPYEWSEQDIGVQIRNYLNCGEFVKSIRLSGVPSTIPLGMAF
ncbi:MAG: hypothetical protein FWG72_06565 [Oscillospiraceae bacterium]|nr:hypothetical protein [Oscillospiraceae bacterium]